MSRKQTVEYIDDLTGERGEVRPITFGWDHVWYEIDLASHHSAELFQKLQPYIRAARPLLRIPNLAAKPKPPRRKGKYCGLPRETLRAIRAFVMARHGVQLPDYGRVAAQWIELWMAAGQPSLQQIRHGAF